MSTREELIDALVEAAHESCEADGTLRIDWAREAFRRVLAEKFDAGDREAGWR